MMSFDGCLSAGIKATPREGPAIRAGCLEEFGILVDTREPASHVNAASASPKKFQKTLEPLTASTLACVFAPFTALACGNLELIA